MSATDECMERRDEAEEARVLLANAPVSYGAFEITVGSNPYVPDAQRLLSAVSAAGYLGIDLGPAGYLSGEETLAARLREHGLQLAGAYIQLPFSEPDALALAWDELVALLDQLETLAPQAEPPKPTLADAGSPARQRHPGVAAKDPSAGLDAAGWERFVAGLDKVADACRGRGFEPTLHPHAGTYVEAGWEVERLLETTDVDICFDPGHLLIGGIDPVAALPRWADRINHFHLKDVRRAAVERLGAEGAQLDRYYSGEVFCRLGEGDAGVSEAITHIRASEYRGWVVVEQDYIPESASMMDRAIADQEANLQFLKSRGL